MTSVWKRLQRVGKKASKFQFIASYQELVLECTKKWQPDKLRVVWTRRNRRMCSKLHSWQPGIKNPYRGTVVWPVPENIDISVTLFKEPNTDEFEDKEWTFVLEGENKGHRKVLASADINLKRFASPTPTQTDLTLKLKPLSVKVVEAELKLSLSCVFIREGKATDEDMQSLASLMSVKPTDIGNMDDFNESDEEEDRKSVTATAPTTPQQRPQEVQIAGHSHVFRPQVVKSIARPTSPSPLSTDASPLSSSSVPKCPPAGSESGSSFPVPRVDKETTIGPMSKDKTSPASIQAETNRRTLEQSKLIITESKAGKTSLENKTNEKPSLTEQLEGAALQKEQEKQSEIQKKEGERRRKEEEQKEMLLRQKEKEMQKYEEERKRLLEEEKRRLLQEEETAKKEREKMKLEEARLLKDKRDKHEKMMEEQEHRKREQEKRLLESEAKKENLKREVEKQQERERFMEKIKEEEKQIEEQRKKREEVKMRLSEQEERRKMEERLLKEASEREQQKKDEERKKEEAEKKRCKEEESKMRKEKERLKEAEDKRKKEEEDEKRKAEEKKRLDDEQNKREEEEKRLKEVEEREKKKEERKRVKEAEEKRKKEQEEKERFFKEEREWIERNKKDEEEKRRDKENRRKERLLIEQREKERMQKEAEERKKREEERQRQLQEEQRRLAAEKKIKEEKEKEERKMKEQKKLVQQKEELEIRKKKDEEEKARSILLSIVEDNKSDEDKEKMKIISPLGFKQSLTDIEGEIKIQLPAPRFPPLVKTNITAKQLPEQISIQSDDIKKLSEPNSAFNECSPKEESNKLDTLVTPQHQITAEENSDIHLKSPKPSSKLVPEEPKEPVRLTLQPAGEQTDFLPPKPKRELRQERDLQLSGKMQQEGEDEKKPAEVVDQETLVINEEPPGNAENKLWAAVEESTAQAGMERGMESTESPAVKEEEEGVLGG